MRNDMPEALTSRRHPHEHDLTVLMKAIAEALDGAEGEQGELEGEPLPLRLDVQPDDGHGQRVVCTPP